MKNNQHVMNLKDDTDDADFTFGENASLSSQIFVSSVQIRVIRVIRVLKTENPIIISYIFHVP
jgi:hypothetical protein